MSHIRFSKTNSLNFSRISADLDFLAYFYYRKKSSYLNKNVNLGFIFLRISEYSFFRIYIPLIFSIL